MGDGWMDGRTDGRVMDGPKWSVLYKMFRHTPLRVSFQHLRKHFSLCLLFTFPEPVAHLARYLLVVPLLSPFTIMHCCTIW